MSQTLNDAQLIRTTALPAANATANGASIDLGTTSLETNLFDASLSLPATPSLVDTKLITITLQDSADNSSFAPITGLSTLVVTGTPTGGPATERIVRLPPTTRRYVRASAAVESGGGNNTAVSFTLALNF